MDGVWAITTIGETATSGPGRECRTVGVFETLEKADKVLRKNWGDLNEAGYYPFSVIELIKFGLYPELGESYFYEYRDDKWVILEERPFDTDSDLLAQIG